MKQPPRTWFGTITRPASHLAGTIVVFTIIVAATVLSVNFPQWQGLLFVAALVPALLWYVLMMMAYSRIRRRPHG